MPDADTVERVTVELTAEELELVRTALRLLRSMLGRDEAAELSKVSEVLDKIEQLAARGSA